MQVATFEQDNSSAALGAQQALEVTMTSDASFMTMMFSNLYTNQVLAAVREPICNAWDAMIEADKANQCIDITFDRESGDLSIRDYGNGIPKDKIDKIYGVFGGSTKRADSKTTGGFGLGSKAPWALVDSFRVTSRNNGNMSVYNMAKSTLESQGKPQIIPMVDVACPDTDSGLMVQFRVPEDKIKQVEGYIQNVILMGDIKATFNGNKMKNLELSTEPGSYTVDDEWFSRRMFTNQDEKIFIRYGTVVYPILRVPGTEKAISLLEDFMYILGLGRVLIQAAPSSLGLTPARESLSSGTLTETGLTQLCVDLISKIEKEITETLPITLAGIESKLMENWMGFNLKEFRDPLIVVDFLDQLPNLQKRFYTSKLGTSYRDKWTPRLLLAEHVGWKKQAKVLFPKDFSMLKKLRNYESRITGKLYQNPNYVSYMEEIFDTKWFIPTLKIIGRSGFNLNDVRWVDGSTYGRDSYLIKDKENNWRAQSCYKVAGISSALELLHTLKSKNVVIYSGQFDREYFNAIPELKSNWHQTRHSFIIKVKSDENLKAEIAKLRSLGVIVTDLRLTYDWDPKVIRAKAKKEKARLALEKARETRRKKAEERKAAGLVKPEKPRGKNALGTLRSYLGVVRSKMDLLEPEFTTETPKLYVKVDDFNQNYITQFWMMKWLTEDEKDNIVVVRNGIEIKMAEKRGAKDAHAYFAAKLFAIVSEPGYKKYFTKLRRKSLSTQCDFQSFVFKDMEALGIPLKGLDKLTHNELYEKVATIYNANYGKVYAILLPSGSTEAEVKKFIALAKLKLDIPLISKLKNVYRDSMLQGIIYYCSRGKGLRPILKEYPERKQAIKQIVLSAFNRKDSKDA